MARPALLRVLAILSFPALVHAQTLASNVVSADGPVNIVFPSRADACGDGQSFIRLPRGGRGDEMYIGSNVFSGSTSWSTRPCSRGPARVLATVLSGEVTRLSSFVGPVPSSSTATRTLTVSAADASAWLGELGSRAPSRVASQAIRAMMFSEAPAPWPLMVRIAKTTERPSEARKAALQWLSFGVTERLGLADFDERATEADEMRTQAVFVLTQGKRTETVPELVDLTRTAKYPSARKAAIFWLGQTGDPRAADVFAELLGIR